MNDIPINLDKLINSGIGALIAYAVWTFKKSIDSFERALKSLNNRVIRIETTHEVKGCATPNREDNSDQY